MKRLLAVAALALPLSALALPAQALSPYTITQTFQVAPKSSGTQTIYCNYPDFADAALVKKGSPVKTTATIFKSVEAQYPDEGDFREGVVVTYTNKSNSTQSFTVNLMCEPD